MKKIKNNKGFTLLEVIFAVSILTIGILSVAAMQAGSIRGNAFAWGTTEASNVAMSRMESMMIGNYDSLADGGPVTSGKYTTTWAVVENAMMNQTKTVTVTVTWKDHGLSRNVTMSSIIGKDLKKEE